MITLYGSAKTSAGRCFWCLEEAGIEYQTKSINFRENEHKSAEFLKVNPNGKIPALLDDDYTIWESSAINFYLAEAYKPELLGANAKEKGLVHQWSTWSMVDLQVPMIDAFIQLIFVPDERRDFKVIEKALAKLPAMMDTIELRLQGSEYLAGSEFTLADLHVISVIDICETIKFDLSKYEKISAWQTKIRNRSAYKKFKELCV
ncbi:hypothetical protein A9Q84_15495 [Halobacteriovorax marinus]|uniref:Glutathione S-transferase n=1 Tax=Halobacteriovorax marinus TaxID=97084 RepID=A0A1Y5F4C0_9BACT|nr:hypothetical protein A9Q84_15495 [Halobacteriovorax marinus]